MNLTRRDLLVGGAAAFALKSAQADALEPAPFEVTRLELRISGLAPEHDGLVVAQLSDLHVGKGSPDGRVIAAVRKVNALEPDLVLLTGDYVTWIGDPIARVPELLAPLGGPVVACMGNHDHWVDVNGLRKGLEKNGYCVLQNQHTQVSLRGAPVTLLGVDDGFTRHDDVGATFRGAPKGGTRLVLAHTPTTVRKLPAKDGLVCFSGHTHGGQIFLPGITQAFFSIGGQPYLRGRYEVNGNQLYVNRGLGFGRGTTHPRVGSEPELSLFTLRRA